MTMKENIDNWCFKRRTDLNADQTQTIADITAQADDLYTTIHKLESDTRYKALAKTALEEAVMWATKSVTHHDRPKWVNESF